VSEIGTTATEKSFVPIAKPPQLKKRYITMMTRRMFSTSILAGAATALLLTKRNSLER
jgi:hypothetical protein